jgi:hypothetical protein
MIAATFETVRTHLAAEEKARGKEGEIQEHKTSMLSFLTTGLELEEKQYVCEAFLAAIWFHGAVHRRLLRERIAALPKNANAKKDADITEKRTSLYRQILVWRKVQAAYMPNVAEYIGEQASEDGKNAENVEAESVKLWLPLVLRPEDRYPINRISGAEAKLREAEAYDAVSEICRIRRVITGVTTFKQYNLAGEGNTVNTKMRTLYNSLQLKINCAASRYIHACKALLILDPKGAWQEELRVLNPKEHIKGPGKEDGDSHGNYVPSWIWLVRTGAQNLSKAQMEESVDNNLRVEWCRARARALRWREEVQLLQEEMRRTVTHLFWKATWWDSQSEADVSISDDIQAGLKAYASKQAWYCRSLATSSLITWKPVLTGLNLSTKWTDEWKVSYPPPKGSGKGGSGERESRSRWTMTIATMIRIRTTSIPSSSISHSTTEMITYTPSILF